MLSNASWCMLRKGARNPVPADTTRAGYGPKAGTWQGQPAGFCRLKIAWPAAAISVPPVAVVVDMQVAALLT